MIFFQGKNICYSLMICFLLSIMLPVHYRAESAVKYVMLAKVASIRKNSIVTLASRKKPRHKQYYILHNKTVIGEVRLLTVLHVDHSEEYAYTMLAKYTLNRKYNSVFRSGVHIGLTKKEKKKEVHYVDRRIKERIDYKKKIVTDIDGKQMVLVAGGKFIFGANNSEKDEYPQHEVIVGDFYIDKYEVSNHDYYTYITRTKHKAPKAWAGTLYPKGTKNFPVLVSYKEAEAYAVWADKRLPTEQEWEKAANGIQTATRHYTDDGYFEIIKHTIYPWGNVFSPSHANCLDFWQQDSIGKKIKEKYQAGLLPVTFFSKKGTSAYGAVNMSGNAAEWTSSWYAAYPGNTFKHRRFGKQVKVIKGGAWYNSFDRLRIAAREYGGIPNLYEDTIAGFRCVKDPDEGDIQHTEQ